MESGIFDTSRGGRLDNPERLKELQPLKLIKAIAGTVSGMTCIDLGSGTGVFALPLAEAVGSQGTVYAIDRSADMLALLKEKEPPQNLLMLQADVAETGLKSKIADLCLLALILHEVTSPEQVLKETWRILKPGGKLIIIEWKKEIDRGPPSSVKIAREKIEGMLADTKINFNEYIDWSRNFYVVIGQKLW